MNLYDTCSLKVIHAWAKNKSGTLFYHNISNLKNLTGLDCFVIIKGKYKNGEKFKKELRVSYSSYKELIDISCENIKKRHGLRTTQRN